MATVTNKRKVLGVEGKVKVIRELENEREKPKLSFVRNLDSYIMRSKRFVKTEPKLSDSSNRAGRE